MLSTCARSDLVWVSLLGAELGAGDVGLALTYAITLMGMFQWGVRQSAEVETLVSLPV